MSNNSDKLQGRRRFLTGVGLAAATATVATSAKAASNSDAANNGFTPTHHAEDAWYDANSAGHRVFIDTSNSSGGVTALNYASNIMVGHTDAYAGSAESDIATIICFRHGATPLGYNDAMWAKYGTQFSQMLNLKDRTTDGPFKINPMNQSEQDFGNRGNTLASLAARGVSYAICAKATRAFSGRLASATGENADDIFNELIVNNIPNGRFVPAGVLAATRSQEYGYSLLYSA
ncbi:MAG: hypothetical protein DHS20C12_02250 [Pseudohongiella sp.]|nr:MAG: hypothetical protein DHS20C12_02250 [Pseudohongiella sp.]